MIEKVRRNFGRLRFFRINRQELHPKPPTSGDCVITQATGNVYGEITE